MNRLTIVPIACVVMANACSDPVRVDDQDEPDFATVADRTGAHPHAVNIRQINDTVLVGSSGRLKLLMMKSGDKSTIVYFYPGRTRRSFRVLSISHTSGGLALVGTAAGRGKATFSASRGDAVWLLPIAPVSLPSPSSPSDLTTTPISAMVAGGCEWGWVDYEGEGDPNDVPLDPESGDETLYECWDPNSLGLPSDTEAAEMIASADQLEAGAEGKCCEDEAREASRSARLGATAAIAATTVCFVKWSVVTGIACVTAAYVHQLALEEIAEDLQGLKQCRDVSRLQPDCIASGIACGRRQPPFRFTWAGSIISRSA